MSLLISFLPRFLTVLCPQVDNITTSLTQFPHTRRSPHNVPHID